MKEVNIENLKGGMIVSGNIFPYDHNLPFISNEHKITKRIQEKRIRMRLSRTTAIYTREDIIKAEKSKEILHSIDSCNLNKCYKNTVGIVSFLEDRVSELPSIVCLSPGELKIVKAVVLTIQREILRDIGYTDTLLSLELSSDYTFKHSVNVGIIATVIGTRLKLGVENLHILMKAGLLHDIGKQLMPEYILNKQDKLTTQERSLIKKHPKYGVEILSRVAGVKDIVIDCIGKHHERLDGTGYPNAYTEASIGLLVRIISIADVYEALVSERPYKFSWTPKDALIELYSGTPQKYDKKVLGALTTIVVIYKVGTIVQLSNGMLGKIIMNNCGFPLRPVIQLILGGLNNTHQSSQCVVNLARDRCYESITVVRELDVVLEG